MGCSLDELQIKLTNVEGCEILQVVDIFEDFRYLSFKFRDKCYGVFFKKKELKWRFFPYNLVILKENLEFFDDDCKEKEKKNKLIFESMIKDREDTIVSSMSSYDILMKIKKG